MQSIALRMERFVQPSTQKKMKKYLLIIKHLIDIIYLSVKDGFKFIKFTELLNIKEDEINRIQFELTVGVHSLEKGLSYRNKKKDLERLRQ